MSVVEHEYEHCGRDPRFREHQRKQHLERPVQNARSTWRKEHPSRRGNAPGQYIHRRYSAYGNLVKTGTGQLIVGGNWTYTPNGTGNYGETKIFNGTIQLTSGTLPSTTKLTLGDPNTNANTSGILDLYGRSQTVTGLYTAGAGTGNQVINTSATTGTLTINVPVSTTDTFAGTLGVGSKNNFGLTVGGSGTLVVSGTNNAYPGAPQSAAALLQPGVVNALPTAGAVTTTGGVLDLGTLSRPSPAPSPSRAAPCKTARSPTTGSTTTAAAARSPRSWRAAWA